MSTSNIEQEMAENEEKCAELNEQDSHKDCDQKSSNKEKFQINEETPRLTGDDGWLDIIGSGDFKKRVIKTGLGVDTRPKSKDLVTVNYTCSDSSDNVIEQHEQFEMISGDLEVVEGFDIAIDLMEEGETAEILIPSRLAYGTIGRKPDITPESNLRYIVEILKVEKIDEESLTPSRILHLGNRKRDIGNTWYDRGHYRQAIHCYNRAAEFLDSADEIVHGSDVSPEILQNILDTKIKVYNNNVAAQLKVEAYDQALKSVNFVLKIQPKNVKALYRKTKILVSKGETDEALVCIKKAAELEPETKAVQQELARVKARILKEEKDQREMYKRMFPPSSSKSSSSRKWFKHLTLMAGSCCVALAVGVAAYRQYIA